MKDLKKRVVYLLEKYSMYYEDIDILRTSEAFVDEMNRGLRGEDSSLMMICTYISPEGEIPPGEPVIAVDAGGTNFRVALVRFDEKRMPVIDYFKTYPMLGTERELYGQEFFDTVSQYLLPVIDRSRKIGFCFSFPTEILPNKDGRLIMFDKEVRVRDVEGVNIGEQLLKILKKKGVAEDKNIVLLNDTVATLLGGKASNPERTYDSYIGFILGTGTNTCYIEDNRNITKVPSVAMQEGFTIINIESGGFDKVPRGEIDIRFDSSTDNPGAQKFEKMISGAYLGRLVLEIMKIAAAEGLFSKEFAGRIREIRNLTTRDINEFTLSGHFDCGNEADEKDRVILYYIIDSVLERAARLAAANLAGVMLKTGKGKNPCLPVCVAAEGTTFHKSRLFKYKLDYYIKRFLNDEMGIYCDFVKAENIVLTGAAIAGLLN